MASKPTKAAAASARATTVSDSMTDDQRLAVINGTLIPMTHPDGGTCDLYKSDASGCILVPAIEAAAMLEHGFVVAGDAAPAAD